MTVHLILAAVATLLGQTHPAATTPLATPAATTPAATTPAAVSPVPGSISGVVVNASGDGSPVGGADVVLRVQLEGRFVIAAECVADQQGRFVFDQIPADGGYVYLPGASHAGIHYPGPRLTLPPETPHARVKLPVHETVDHPSPLVLRRHDITLQPEAGALRVTETLLVHNPTSRTYIGRPAKEGGRAATLWLSIPSDFRRTTFHQEFFGRQFTLIDGRLVTDVPWTPGQRELSFTYVLPNEERYRVWQRSLDVPCEHLRINVHADLSPHVRCDLPRVASQEEGLLTFESKDSKILQPGKEVRVQLGRLPVPFATYGRWAALAGLVGLILATSLFRAYRPWKNPESAVAAS